MCLGRYNLRCSLISYSTVWIAYYLIHMICVVCLLHLTSVSSCIRMVVHSLFVLSGSPIHISVLFELTLSPENSTLDFSRLWCGPVCSSGSYFCGVLECAWGLSFLCRLSSFQLQNNKQLLDWDHMSSCADLICVCIQLKNFASLFLTVVWMVGVRSASLSAVLPANHCSV